MKVRIALIIFGLLNTILLPAWSEEVHTRDQEIRLEGVGGVILQGILTLPDRPVPSGGKWPVIVMMHHYGRNRDGLIPLAQALAEAGFGSALVDMRGHGDSRYTVDRKLFTFPVVNISELSGGGEDLQKIVQEVLKFPEVDKTRMGMVGVGVGGLMAAAAAARLPIVKALVIVDPVEAVAGYRPDRDLGLFGDRPVLLVSSGFSQSKTRAETLTEFGSGMRDIASVDTLEIFDLILQPGFPATTQIVEWLKKVMKP